MSKTEFCSGVKILLERMDKREATVLRLRFGVDGDQPRTLKEIGEQLGLTRERVRQLQQSALMKLRRMMTERQKLLTPEDVRKNRMADARAEVLREFFRSKGARLPDRQRPDREGL